MPPREHALGGKIITDTAYEPAPAPRATPIHLWLVGAISLAWNAFGCLDYTMTETRNAAYLARMTPEQLAYFNSFPAWAVALWAIGVWGGLAGSILLLLRHRWAVPTLAVSLAGAALGLVGQHLLPGRPASLSGAGMTIFGLVIVAIAAALWWYARAMRARGVLR